MKTFFSMRLFISISMIATIVAFALGFTSNSRRASSFFYKSFTSLVQKALSDSSEDIDISESDEIAFRSIAKRYLSSKFQECNADGNECKAFRGIDEASKNLAQYLDLLH